MSDIEQPQLYLISPPEIDLEVFPKLLSQALDAVDIACVRLALATRDEDKICRAADAVREITHAHDVALVIEDHLLLVERLGLDGVHLSDGSRSVAKTRKELGTDAIVGAFCAVSRHDGMTAGEASADYVSFGPVRDGVLGDGSAAERDVFEWWSEVVEVPIVAEGAMDLATARDLAPITDFIALGEEIWSTADPVAALKDFAAAIQIG